MVALLGEYTDLDGQVRAFATLLRNNSECAYRPSGLSGELIVASRSGKALLALAQMLSDEEREKYLAVAVKTFPYGVHLAVVRSLVKQARNSPWMLRDAE